MGKPDFGKKVNIFHLLEWIISLLAAICIADSACINCGKHFIEMQFIDAATFGVFMFMCIVFFGMFFSEDVPDKADICWSILAAVMDIVAAIMVLIYVNKNSDYLDDSDYFRLLIGGVSLGANGFIFLVEFCLLLFKKDLLK